MASILLSFVGSQDPYSNNTNLEGSIVTLVKHLITEQITIKKILLLYTKDLIKQAKDTKEWLNSDLKIAPENIEIIEVSQGLSEDPINVSLTLPDARNCLKTAQNIQNNQDIIEFNSSSGTPAMKTTWSILQAAGIAKNSRIWQVRNPIQMKIGQERVFVNNVNVVKNEADLKVIKKQLQNYNYTGALSSLENSDFDSEIAKILMEYGRCRLEFDFNKAFDAINTYKNQIDSIFLSQINDLRQKKSVNILIEVYYKLIITLKTQQYADFLILLFAFEENLLRYLVKKMLFSAPEINKDWSYLENQGKVKEKIKTFDSGKLLEYLTNERKLRIDVTFYLTRPILQAILEYNSSNYSEIIPLINELNKYAENRNDIVHNLTGISELKAAPEILTTVKNILRKITEIEINNPFNLLNEVIIKELTNTFN